MMGEIRCFQKRPGLRGQGYLERGRRWVYSKVERWAVHILILLIIHSHRLRWEFHYHLSNVHNIRKGI